MQINITGFLNGKNARVFMKELWELLLSAQTNIGGIPTAFLEKKKEEIRQRKVSIPTEGYNGVLLLFVVHTFVGAEV